MNNDIDKDYCAIKSESIKNSVKNLELRIFETLKKITQLSDMAHNGHKEALRSVILSIQKDLDINTKKFEQIEQGVKDLQSLDSKTEFKVLFIEIAALKRKIKLLTRTVIIICGVLLVFIITKGDFTATIKFIIKLLAF